MTGYGEQLGVAFQLADDLSTSPRDAGETGKTPGTDLREGVPTLPVLLRAAVQRPRRRAAAPAAAPATCADDDALHAEALALLRATRRDASRPASTTRQVGAEAGALLAPLPPSAAKAALLALVEAVVDRVG